MKLNNQNLTWIAVLAGLAYCLGSAIITKQWVESVVLGSGSIHFFYHWYIRQHCDCHKNKE